MTPEELLKEVGDPIAYYDPDLDCESAGISFDPLSDGIGLYTSDQLAAAVARATKPLEDSLAVVKKDRADLYMETLTLRDQLAKAEQRVAEACALYIHSTKGAVGSINMAEAVLSGEWRKFVKEV